MNNKIFEIDINNKIQQMKICIENEWGIPNGYVEILIREYEKMKKENKTLKEKLNYLNSTKDCDEEFEL